MPRTGITAYDLLISCPGDVLQYAEIVKECVESFNHTLGCINNAEIVTRHWATDSFPQSGDRPQELLNKQFVRDCDAAVAIFWTKFGTPTDKYGSGTEEEIEEMLSSGKQVFLYFVDAPINPSVIDMEQYHKVNDFKEKYKGRGLYGLVKDESDLRKQFANHLTMYFLPIITGEISQDTTTVAPLLQIQDYDSGNEDVVTYQQLALSNCKLMSDKVQAIYTLIDNLKDNYLPQRTPEKQEENLLIAARAKKMSIEAEKLTGDNIYKVLIYFDKLYSVMNEQEKRQIMESLISEIQIYPERQPNGQWLKSIKFKLPIIEEDMNISLDNDSQVETVVLLRKAAP